VTLSGLLPDTLYYYSVGTSSQTLAGDDANHFFRTAPPPGTTRSSRIWVLGDSGSKNNSARAVRNAYYAFTGSTHTDLWLMLGDNAYSDGSDQDYQDAVFEMYPEMLTKSVLWPALGNHDDVDTATEAGAYFDIFTLPSEGQAGGVASGTESYYSFDHGSVHFICLNTAEFNSGRRQAMYSWLQSDLAARDREWTVAFFHHPPYSKANHDSDTSTQLVRVREIILPMLEAAGVDLVLSGHSHAYERSFLLDGHYGVSITFDAETMVLDGGSGRSGEDGPYMKSQGSMPHDGAVYVVAGCSGKSDSGPFNHPAMFLGYETLGSVVIDSSDGRLDVTLLEATGRIGDSFSILKPQGTRFLRGDCNGDGMVAGQVSDAIYLLLYNLERASAPPCAAACDANGDGAFAGKLTDAVFLLDFAFQNGPPPPPPFPRCGPAGLPSDLILGCESQPGACGAR
jgi:hypothetical protein